MPIKCQDNRILPLSFQRPCCQSGLDPESRTVELPCYRGLDPGSESGMTGWVVALYLSFQYPCCHSSESWNPCIENMVEYNCYHHT